MKKVLIITYYWPPAGGPGVQRVLKFAKYLPAFGWQPIILTVKNGEYPAHDETLVNNIPKECKVFTTRTFEPFNLYRKFTNRCKYEKIPTYVLNSAQKDNFRDRIAKWIRANLFIPDARIGWIPYAVKEGLKIIKNEKVDIIFSSSPPHSVQIIANKLAKKTSLKWITDFRDPWQDAFWQKDIVRKNFAKNKDKKIEGKILKSSNCIIGVSNSIIKLFGNRVKNNYFTIPNGFDETDFVSCKKVKSNKFRITYTGNLGKDQSLHNFFSAISKLDERTIKLIEINFFGNLHQSILDNIKKFQLTDIIKINPYTTHEKSIEVIINSDMLLLCIPNVPNNDGIVTGKLFEYLATNNFILGIGPKTGDASKILEKTNCGKMFDFDENLENIILLQFEKWKNNKQIKVNESEILKYTRKKINKKIS